VLCYGFGFFCQEAVAMVLAFSAAALFVDLPVMSFNALCEFMFRREVELSFF